ncbi:hypothetical protein I5J44_gp39 [Mycobacterium phage Phineas]|uniref:hypothetical protein n=1 Tax=Mycobacterium phage Phineas TaxID=2575357 RepID=UPI001164079D|nr:hypothetical protein I5J44_gp39 [Mycobacterium phage Phineas]QDB74286.1 hypothetical protein SEA_PHINEAS_39 [Mycobacterium phage Phineas]
MARRPNLLRRNGVGTEDTLGVAHSATVVPRRSEIFGDTYQPVCSCGYRGGHFSGEPRAMAAAEEHEDRAAGRRVTVK